MAKMHSQDERVEFIETIGRTENIKVLRNIAFAMASRKYSANINMIDRANIFQQGMERIESLLGSAAVDFKPLQEMKKRKCDSYFDKVEKGISEIDKEKQIKQEIERICQDYERKIQGYKEKGKYDKAKDYEIRLNCVNHSEEMKQNLENSLSEYETKLLNKELDADSYLAIKKNCEKYLKICNTYIKKRNKKNDDSLLFYKRMQEEIRNFICYLFFNRENSLSDTPNKYLSGYDGEIILDFEHVLVLYQYLKSVDYRNLNEIEAILTYYALEDYAVSINSLNQQYGKEKGIVLPDGPMGFVSQSIRNYMRKYTPFYLCPLGYNGYIFEPKSLFQQSFISAIDLNDLKLETMVSKYKDAQQFMSSRNKGIFFSFLDKDLENKLIPKLITSSFSLMDMDGLYSEQLLKEYQKRREVFGNSDGVDIMTNMFSRVVIPYALEVLGSYVRVYCDNLNKLRDKSMIFIYYVSPQRIAIAIRDDITDDMLSEVFEPSFINKLEKIEKPTLDKIVQGEYL